MTLKYLKDVVTLSLDSERCTGCLECIDVCPHNVFTAAGKKVRIADRDLCMECGACALNCSAGAIEVQAGVGCAAAIIKGWFTGQEPTCDCGGGSDCC